MVLVSIVLLLVYIFTCLRTNPSGGCAPRKCRPSKRKHHNSTHSVDTEYQLIDQISSFVITQRPPEFTTKSTNWAGYVAAKSMTQPVTGSCVAVAGTFIVPSLQYDIDEPMDNVSIWVGIDGGVASAPTVQQLGVDLANVGGRMQAYAWFEMYPASAYQIVGFPVNAGDSITASVNFISGNQYQLMMTNNTRRVRAIIPPAYTKSTIAKRQCVEWIVEAPYYRGILPLTHFNPVVFTNCTAVISGVGGSISKFAHDNFNMVSVGANNVTTPKATTSVLDTSGNSFRVTWQHI